MFCHNRSHMKLALCSLILMVLTSSGPYAQDIFTYHGDPIPQEVETLYSRGLKYLIRNQTREGNWAGSYGSNPGVVGLAVLAMLAHGEDANTGPYSEGIRSGINFILKSAQADNGYIGSSMYNHGFATLALAEAYGSLDDPRIGPALKKAVDFILTSQAHNPQGAWRYSPTSTDADTTVSGAQLVALFAARNAGIAVPDSAIKKGLRFLRQCQGGDGGIGYTSAGSSNTPRTAIATLCFALAKQKDSQEFESAFKYLQQPGSTSTQYSFYYLYYAAQAFFHGNMDAWNKWNSANIATLSATQGDDGSWSGSHGPVFSTSASLLSLAVNYRFLPIYER